MKTTNQTEYASADVIDTQETGKNDIPKNNGAERAFTELESSVYAALETYANVHRGSGHNSLVSSQLYEHARGVVLEYLGLNKDRYIVIFGSPKRTSELVSQFKPGSYQTITSREVGLPLGITAIAVEKKALPKGSPTECGGGTARLVAAGWIIWNSGPDKFEAGTPPIVNVIAFSKALLLLNRYGKDIFKKLPNNDLGITELLYKDDMERYTGVELMEHLRKTLIGRGFIVPTLEGEKPFVNLDNSASTPTFQPIWNTFRQSLRLPERRKQDVINEVKAVCSELLGAPLGEYDIIFTKNTTESINLVSESLSRSTGKDTEPAVLISLLEHSSNDLPWRMASNKSLVRLSVDEEGFVNLVELENSLREYNHDHKHGKKRIKIVALSGASNVLGTCNDIAKISPIVHKYGAKLLVDGAQVVAHKKVEIEKDEIDFLAFSAHKVYAPFGTGVLIAKKGLLNYKADELKQMQTSGEENIGGIAALGKALVLLRRIGMDVVHEEEQALTKRALDGMSKVPNLRIFGIKDPNSSQFDRKIGVIVFETKDLLHNTLAEEMFQKGGIGVRFGCHCSHLLIKHILDMGKVMEEFQRVVLTVAPKTQLPGVVRVSLGIENTQKDIDILIDVLNRLVSQAKTKPGSDEKKALAQAETNFQKELEEFTQTAIHRVYAYAE